MNQSKIYVGDNKMNFNTTTCTYEKDEEEISKEYMEKFRELSRNKN